MTLTDFDQKYRIKYTHIAGIDEVGRGPLAGPVVAVASSLKTSSKEFLGINDSKKLTEKKRQQLFPKIINSFIFGIGIVSHETIDKINILNATHMAMKLALKNLNLKLKKNNLNKIEYTLIDGLNVKDFPTKSQGIIKGDSKSYLIAASSIIAKVTRDNMMIEYSKKYPHYAFEKNKAYGTLVHRQAIKKYGFCPIHRRSFTVK